MLPNHAATEPSGGGPQGLEYVIKTFEFQNGLNGGLLKFSVKVAVPPKPFAVNVKQSSQSIGVTGESIVTVH